MEQKRICINLRRGDGDELYEYLKMLLVQHNFSLVKTNYEKEEIDKLVKIAKDCDALISGVDAWQEQDLEQVTPRLQLISRMGVGVDHIDLQAARKNGITVTNTVGTNSQAVAEGALALMLSLIRNVTLCDRKLRGGEWYNRFLSRELSSMRIGIVGYGNIGKRVIRLLSGFTQMIYVYDPFVQRPVEGQEYVTFVTLETLAQECDIISLHLPLTENTRHLVDTNFLAMMKPSSYLINTSRGAVVDEQALIEALEQNHISGAALDVFENEPTVPDALKAMNNVVLTTHMLSATKESAFATVNVLVDTIVSFFSGKPKNIVQ